jgi:hypothetical protein
MGSKRTDAGTGRSAPGLGRLLAGLRRPGWRRGGVIVATLALIAGLIVFSEDFSGPGRQRSSPYAAQTLSPPLGISKPPPGSRPPAQDGATDASQRQPSDDTSPPRTHRQHDTSTPQRELESAAGGRSSAPSQQDVSSAGTANPRVDRPPAAAARVAVAGATSVQFTIPPVTRAQARPPKVKVHISKPPAPARPTPTPTAPPPSRGAAALP